MTNDEDAYLARMESRQGARSAYLAKARQGAEAIGRDALALKDLGMSVSEIARRVGIPRPTLNEFIAAAEKSEAGAHSATPPATPLPVLSGNELVTAAREGGPVIEIAASFGDADTLFLSGEPFARFVNPNWGSGMRIPNLMLRLEGRGWIGVANTTVGYGGTGPGNACQALVSVGIDDDLARDIAYGNRVSHIRFDDDGSPEYLQEGSQWPRFGLSAPEPFGDSHDRFRIRMLVDDGFPERDDSAPPREPGYQPGFHPSPPDDLTLWQRWLKYLDSPPAWLPSPTARGGTLFTSLDAAWEAGFCDESRAEREARRQGAVRIGLGGFTSSTYQLIIEQGAVQLWLTAYTSTDPSVWVPREFHDVLRDADLLPEDVVVADEASTLRKLVSRHRNRRPASIPLGVGHATPP